jgi:hypothetical protein
MAALLAALAILAGGYVLAYLVFDRLRRSFGYVGGAEYVLLGIFLGPAGSGLLDQDAVRDLAPVAAVALGWIGVFLGSRLRLREWIAVPPAHLAIGWSEAGTTWGVTAGALWLLLHHLLGFEGTAALLPALALAAVAVAGAPHTIDALAGRQAGRHPLWPLIRTVSTVDAFLAIVVYGLVMAALHIGTIQGEIRPPTPTEWAVINIAVGLGSGLLFHLFLGPAATGLEHEVEVEGHGDARLFIALAGAIVIAGGTAFWLGLSPLFTTFLVGVVLGNSAQVHERIVRLLLRIAQPVYLVLLIFAGAAWRPAGIGALWFVFAFVGVRLLARSIGGRVGGTASDDPALQAPWLGRVLLTQGGLGVAIALDYSQTPGAPAGGLVLSASLLSILLFDWVGSRETVLVLSGGRATGESTVPAEAPDGGTP